MLKYKKISVIVPVYNVANYLPKCIDSILAQTYENIEVILVDDGSTDNSGKICDEYAKKDNRIKVIHKENAGLSSARNKGIEVASGEYLAFIDSDDYISEKMFQLLYDAIGNSELAICGYSCVDEDGKQIKPGTVIENKVMTQEQSFDELCRYNNAGYIIACNKLYKKELFDEIRYPIGKLHEDEFVIHNIFSKCNSIACIDTVLYFYLQRQGSIMKTPSIRRLDGAEAVLNRTDFFVRKGLSAEKVYVSLNKVFNVFKSTYKSKDYITMKQRTRYSELYRQCRKIIKRLIKSELPLRKKCILAMYYISPFVVFVLEKTMYIFLKKVRIRKH